jgi:methionine-rich copper-binding protein CopC
VNISALSHNIRTASAIVCTVLFLIIPNAARGHAYPDHADPRVGSTLTASPERVRIWFDSDLEPAFSTIAVRNADSSLVSNNDGHVNPSDPTLLEVSVSHLPPGTYRVLWSVVARDGHLTAGNYTFSIR